MKIILRMRRENIRKRRGYELFNNSNFYYDDFYNMKMMENLIM